MRSVLKRPGFWLMIAVVALLLALVAHTNRERADLSVPEKVVRDIIAPLQGGVSEFMDHLRGYNVYFADKRDLKKQIEDLKQQVNVLKFENQGLKEYRAEARQLRTILDFKEQAREYTLVTADVIARSPNSWTSSIIINRGSNDGIKKDMAVITPDGLVGRVMAVTRTSAEVVLITNPDMGVGAIVQESRAPGIASGGDIYQHLEMANIPYYIKVNKGEHVVTSGLGHVYPPGIPIGRIAEVKREKGGLTQIAVLDPAASLDQLEKVLVVTRYLGPTSTPENGLYPAQTGGTSGGGQTP